MNRFLLITIGAVLMLLTQLGCKKDACSEDTNCTLEPDPGFCFAAIPRYYYDAEDDECKECIWGGCEGTGPFETLEACRECECNN